MPLQTPTQASQMNAAEPARSFDTSRSVLPQNVQRSRRFGAIPMSFKTFTARASAQRVK
jgi:hypothetical protein